jgi:ribosomal protein S27AE
MTKKYDPLWEIVDEKVALQGKELDLDASCPHCHVIVHLGGSAEDGDRFACGLCGGVATLTAVAGGLALEKATSAD